MTDISQDDVLLWQQTVADVQKIKKTNRAGTKTQKKSLKKTPSETVPLGKNFKHNLELNTHADIDAQTFKRFKKEKFKIEATLDLHGLTIDKAYDAVYHFIVSSYNQNKRVVLIITGKGLEHKEQDIFSPIGSLKQSVPTWLQNDEMKNMILSYTHPTPKLGGSGALYILLRRKR